MRPRLRSYVYFSPVNDGVVFRTWAGTFRLHGKSLYPALERLAPLMTGEHTVAEICRVASISAVEKLESVMELLLSRGVVADEGQLTSVKLSDDVRRAFAASIAYLDMHLADPLPAFLKWRESRVTVIGQGSALLGTVRGLAAAGLERCDIRASVADDEDLTSELAQVLEEIRTDSPGARFCLRDGAESEAERFEGHDLVIYAGVMPSPVERASQMTASDVPPFIQGIADGRIGFVTPVVQPHGMPCWSCVRSAVRTVDGHGSPQCCLFIGSALAFEAFRYLAGVTSSSASSGAQVLTMECDTFETTRRRVVPRPGCACLDAETAALAGDVRNRAGATARGDILSYVETVADPLTGLLRSPSPDGIEQVPLCVVAWWGERDGEDEGPLGAVGRVTLEEALYEGSRRSLEQVTDRYLRASTRNTAWRTVDGTQIDVTGEPLWVVASGQSFEEWIGRGLLSVLTLSDGTLTYGVVSTSAVQAADFLQRCLHEQFGMHAVVYLGTEPTTRAQHAVVAVGEDVLGAALGRTEEEAVVEALQEAMASVQSGWRRFAPTTLSQVIGGATAKPLTLASGKVPGWTEWTERAVRHLRDCGLQPCYQYGPDPARLYQVGLLIGPVASCSAANG